MPIRLSDGPTLQPMLFHSQQVHTGLTLEGRHLNQFQVLQNILISMIYRAGLPQPDNRAAGENPPHQEVRIAQHRGFLVRPSEFKILKLCWPSRQHECSCHR